MNKFILGFLLGLMISLPSLYVKHFPDIQSLIVFVLIRAIMGGLIIYLSNRFYPKSIKYIISTIVFWIPSYIITTQIADTPFFDYGSPIRLFKGSFIPVPTIYGWILSIIISLVISYIIIFIYRKFKQK